MPLRKHSTTQEVREIAQETLDAWTAASNPKAAVWEEYTAPEPPPPPTPEIPWAISNADLRRQLVANGINPALILAYLNGLEEGAAKWAAIADWEYANYFERSHPMLNALAPAFGLTTEAVDAMFLACPAYPRL
jgi:hypothetical protein